MITNIRCMSKHMKRRKKGWQVIAETTETWSSYPISNMLIARDYFGGVMEIKTKSSRRFGNIIESIVVIIDIDYCNISTILRSSSL